MLGFRDLLLDLLFVLLFIFLYFLMGIPRKYSKLAIGFFGACSILLCMTFPFTNWTGFIYDLRSIPLIIGILYGGYPVAIFLALVTFAYRYSVGGAGFIATIVVFSYIIGLSLWIRNRYLRSKLSMKIIWGMSLSSISAGSGMLYLYITQMTKGVPVESDFYQFFAVYGLVHLLAIWLSVVLIEYLRELLAIRKNVVQAEKVRLLGELAAAMAHEVRTPLTVARGFMQLLQETPSLTEKSQKYLKLGADELDRAENIIKNYLAFAKPQADKMEKVDVSERLQQVVSCLTSYARERRIEIREQFISPIWILANAEKVAQVFTNFIKNAIEAIPDAGYVDVTTSISGGFAAIEISDSGVGMTEEEVERLGTPFYSTKDSGTGLGLMVSYRIIEWMQGKVEVTSTKGKGTRFIILLPLYQGSPT